MRGGEDSECHGELPCGLRWFRDLVDKKDANCSGVLGKDLEDLALGVAYRPNSEPDLERSGLVAGGVPASGEAAAWPLRGGGGAGVTGVPAPPASSLNSVSACWLGVA